MIEIGKISELTVADENASGYYLKHDNYDVLIFMPPSLGPGNVKIGDRLSVFIYLDKSGSPLATTHFPSAVVGEYALMNVVETTGFGAFVNWGISKDLLIPDTEQKFPIKKGENHLVRVCLDERTNKIYGTTKLGKYIEMSDFDIEVADEVKLVPFLKDHLGYRVTVNRKFIGMIYHNEIFINDIEIGQTLTGFVKNIRPDGLLDCALQAQGIKNSLDSKDVILNFLKNEGGKSSLCDKSHPEEIKESLNMSKQTFKKAIGMLYKEGKILLSKSGIELL